GRVHQERAEMETASSNQNARPVGRFRAGAVLGLAALVLWTFGAIDLRLAAQQGGQGILDLALERIVRDGDGSTTERVIVRAVPGHLKDARAALGRLHATIVTEHPVIEAITALVRSSDLTTLASSTGIGGVSSDVRLAATGWRATQTSVLNPDLLLDTLGLDDESPRQASRENGHGIHVAVIDSGIAPLRNFDVEAFYDFTGNLTPDVSSPSAPYDDYGHGTHVAGLIANDVKRRSGGRGEQIYQGIAPRADLIGLKVLDGNGQGFTSD